MLGEFVEASFGWIGGGCEFCEGDCGIHTLASTGGRRREREREGHIHSNPLVPLFEKSIAEYLTVVSITSGTPGNVVTVASQVKEARALAASWTSAARETLPTTKHGVARLLTVVTGVGAAVARAVRVRMESIVEKCIFVDGALEL